jgi:hypothetical protein
LTRCRRSGEVLIGRPGVSVTPAPAPSFRDFDELRCMACGARLDWELDHRSLYELDRRV